MLSALIHALLLRRSRPRHPRPLRPLHGLALCVGLALLAGTGAASAQATDTSAIQPSAGVDPLIRDAREAFVRRDRSRLAAFRIAAIDSRHPLAPWVDYWDLTGRLNEATADEVEAFYARWPASYVEDRLRNDWLLELGRRRDWAAFSRDLPRFRMNDDRQVHCYAVLVDHLAGKPVLDAARRVWMAQREPDDACLLMGRTLFEAKVFSADDIWRRVRLGVENNRVKLARQSAALLGDPVDKALVELLDKPTRYLLTKASSLTHHRSELASLAVARVAASDTDAAANLLQERWAAILGAEHAAWAWSQVAKQGALQLRPESLGWTRNAFEALPKRQTNTPDWSDDTLGWLARSALRNGQGSERWIWTLRSIEAMSATERADPAWAYWRARGVLGMAPAAEAGEAARNEARRLLQGIASPLNFYGQLAAEELGNIAPLPGRPVSPTGAEQAAARNHAGLQRALLAIGMGLRSEGVREWNFSLIGMSDRELIAAAQLACDREVWDRCINSADRTRAEIDLTLRYPTPLRRELLAKAGDIGLDPAYVYGLIRQESRFIVDARSNVGASGLMQVMPATAKWTARKIGLTSFRPEMITERDTNLRIGTAYLKLVLDDLGGSQAMAAAAYNAGPGRPRRWREGPVVEAAIWAENIPFNETRDYVKKVLSNATIYAGLLSGKPASLKARLGAPIGPREATAAPANDDLP
ncbi:MAG: lytic transglycosylase [Burkholderiales bacterium PBB6]|nr:MAG: lytic transglycosylase [Burkholderiales bacterium PBB6]